MVVSHASVSTRKESVEAFFAPLRADIDAIREQLKQIVPTISIPAKKGEFTEVSIFESYIKHVWLANKPKKVRFPIFIKLYRVHK